MNCPKCDGEIAEGVEYTFSMVRGKGKEKNPVIPQKIQVTASKRHACGGCGTEVVTHTELSYVLAKGQGA